MPATMSEFLSELAWSKNNKTHETFYVAKLTAERSDKSVKVSNRQNAVNPLLLLLLFFGANAVVHSGPVVSKCWSARVEYDYLKSGRKVRYEPVACLSASSADAISSYSICRSVSFSTSCCLSCADAFSAMECRRR